MGRPGVSKADVVQAYVALLKQKRQPTLVNVRLEIGRGSYSTIGAHLRSLQLVRPRSNERQCQQPQPSRGRLSGLPVRRL